MKHEQFIKLGHRDDVALAMEVGHVAALPYAIDVGASSSGSSLHLGCHLSKVVDPSEEGSTLRRFRCADFSV